MCCMKDCVGLLLNTRGQLCSLMSLSVCTTSKSSTGVSVAVQLSGRIQSPWVDPCNNCVVRWSVRDMHSPYATTYYRSKQTLKPLKWKCIKKKVICPVKSHSIYTNTPLIHNKWEEYYICFCITMCSSEHTNTPFPFHTIPLPLTNQPHSPPLQTPRHPKEGK